jgi:hypothetical protein
VPPDQVVAVAAKGEIAAMTTTRSAFYRTSSVHAVMSPGGMVDGRTTST